MHRHVWKIVQKETLPSIFDNYLASLARNNLTAVEFGKVPHNFLIYDRLITSRCEICGTEKVEKL